MSVHWKVEIDNGKVWVVGSMIPDREDRSQGQVVIPIEEIDGMTDEEIGQAVRRLAPDAEFAGALDIAYNWLTYKGANVLMTAPLADDYLRLRRHAGTHQTIDEALALFEETLELERRQAARRASSRRSRPGFVYVVAGGGYYKIGKSQKVPARLRNFGLLLPFPVELIHSFPVDDCDQSEQRLHAMFADKRINGEWFDLTADDLALITQELAVPVAMGGGDE